MSRPQANFDPRETLHATIAALSAFDLDTLEGLQKQALAAQAGGAICADFHSSRAQPLHATLAHLLESTRRNLDTLRSLHDTAVQSAREAAWER